MICFTLLQFMRSGCSIDAHMQMEILNGKRKSTWLWSFIFLLIVNWLEVFAVGLCSIEYKYWAWVTDECLCIATLLMNKINFHFAIVFLQLVASQKNTKGKKAKADTSSIQWRTFSDMKWRKHTGKVHNAHTLRLT